MGLHILRHQSVSKTKFNKRILINFNIDFECKNYFFPQSIVWYSHLCCSGCCILPYVSALVTNVELILDIGVHEFIIILYIFTLRLK